MSEAVFALPDLGEGLTSAEVLTWLVGEGDLIEIDQEIVTVETAKASVDVPSPYAGRVLRLHAQVGDTVPVGADLITVEPLVDDAAALPPSVSPRVAVDASETSGAVLIGYGTTPLPPRSARGRRRRALTSVDVEAFMPPANTAAAAVKVISPLVRRAAAERGVDLQRVQPSGPDGIIRRADIEHTFGSASDGSAPVGSAPDSRRIPDSHRIPLTGIRGAVAQKVSRSRTEIPDATAWVDVDATEFMAAAAAMTRHHPERPIGVLPLLARTVVAGLAQFPELNASVDTEAGEIVQHHEVNLGIAMQTPRGLVVPVIKGSTQMTTRDLAEALATLTEQARSGSLPPESMIGGTFTLNNYGVFGIDGSTPIVNHPEAGMIGVGRIMDRPWAHHGEIALRSVGQVSITFDHRVCDGGAAAGLLRFVADCMENPAVLLANL